MENFKFFFLSLILMLGGTLFPTYGGKLIRSYTKNEKRYYEWLEENGFRWVKVSRHSYEGAETVDGRTIIPLSRNYSFVCYHPETDHPDGGYFEVDKNGYEGVVNLRGKEVIPPTQYDGIIWSENHYEGRKNDKWVDIDCKLSDYTASSSSTSSSSSATPSSSNSSRQIYHYTKSGRGQSSTGQWTDNIGSSEYDVQFMDDEIIVNGIHCPYRKTSGGWKVYEATSMGFNGSTTTIYYYVDGSKNMKEVNIFTSAFGSDVFTYPMSQYGDPTPYGENNVSSTTGSGSSSGNSGNNRRSNSGSSYKQHGYVECSTCRGTGKCQYCNGTGYKIVYGATKACANCRGNSKKCSICHGSGKVYK